MLIRCIGLIESSDAPCADMVVTMLREIYGGKNMMVLALNGDVRETRWDHAGQHVECHVINILAALRCLLQ